MQGKLFPGLFIQCACHGKVAESLERSDGVGRYFVKDSCYSRSGYAVIGFGKHLKNGLDQINVGISLTLADDLTGFKKNVDGLGFIDPDQRFLVMGQDCLPGVLIRYTCNGDSMSALKMGHSVYGFLTVDSVRYNGRMRRVIF